MNENPFRSLDDFLNDLFEKDLNDPSVYDVEVVRAIKEKLCSGNIHSRAGNLIADELIQVAKSRSKGGKV